MKLFQGDASVLLAGILAFPRAPPHGPYAHRAQEVSGAVRRKLKGRQRRIIESQSLDCPATPVVRSREDAQSVVRSKIKSVGFGHEMAPIGMKDGIACFRVVEGYDLPRKL